MEPGHQQNITQEEREHEIARRQRADSWLKMVKQNSTRPNGSQLPLQPGVLCLSSTKDRLIGGSMVQPMIYSVEYAILFWATPPEDLKTEDIRHHSFCFLKVSVEVLTDLRVLMFAYW